MTAKEQRKAAEDFAAKWLGRGYEKGECQKFWRGLLHDVFGVADPDDWVQYEAPGAGEKKRRFARVVNGRARRAARTPPLWPSRELRVFAFAEGVGFCGGGCVKAPAYPFGTAPRVWV